MQALIELDNPSRVATRWEGTLLTIATVLALSAFNTFAACHLSVFEGVFAIAHVFVFVPVAVTLWVMAPTSSATTVFLTFTDNGGDWPNFGLSALVGQVSCVFATIGSDSVLHISEEVEDAAVIVPQAMVWSYLCSLPMSFLIIPAWCFNIVSVQEVVQSTSSLVWVLNTTLRNPAACSAFSAVVMVLLSMVTVSTIASTSRQTLAFA